MSYGPRTFACLDCGEVTRRNRGPANVRVCFECGLKRAARAAVEMANKSGPAWEAFKKNPGNVTIGQG